MNREFPKSFYFKLIVILLFSTWVGAEYHPVFRQHFANKDLSLQEKVLESFRTILSMDQPLIQTPSQMVSNLHGPGRTQEDSPVFSDTQNIRLTQPGSELAQEIDPKILEYPNYKLARQKAELFNQQVDLDALNHYFQTAPPLHLQKQIGQHLAKGSRARATELAEHHYLGSNTVDGKSFRSHFTEIPESQFRLGESLYELYIAANDIHIQTWLSHPEVLADHLVKTFSQSMNNQDFAGYRSQYIAVHASPTDYQIDQTSYVRIVVVLTLDAQEGLNANESNS